MKKEIHVVGAVITEGGKILCAQRGATKTLAYKWEFPGGKIEQGETPEAALIRELQEEMECEISVGEKIDYTVYEYDFGIVHLTTYYCKVTAGELKNIEHEAIKWMSPQDLNTLDWAPADIPAISKIMADFTS